MKNIWVFLFLIIVGIGCGTEADPGTVQQDSSRVDGTVVNDSALSTFIKISPDVLSGLQGIYQTILPCSNCPKKIHTVAFYPDQTFMVEESKDGTIESVTQRTGQWGLNGDSIILQADELVAGVYQMRNDSIYYVAPEAVYLLDKLNDTWSDDVWTQKKNAGIDIFGRGNEPFWFVEIDNEKFINFKLADWEQPLSFTAVVPNASADSIWYDVNKGNERLHIAVYNNFCSDGMSDFIYDYEIRVLYKNHWYKGCGFVNNGNR